MTVDRSSDPAAPEAVADVGGGWREQLEAGSEVLVRKASIDQWYKGVVQSVCGNMLKVEFNEVSVPVIKSVFRYSSDLLPLDDHLVKLLCAISESPREIAARKRKHTCPEQTALSQHRLLVPPSDASLMEAQLLLSAKTGVQSVCRPAPHFVREGRQGQSLVGATVRVRSPDEDPEKPFMEAVVVNSAPGQVRVACCSEGKNRIWTVPFETPVQLGLVKEGDNSPHVFTVGSKVWVRSASRDAWCEGVVASLCGSGAKVVFWQGGRTCMKTVKAGSADLWAASETDTN